MNATNRTELKVKSRSQAKKIVERLDGRDKCIACGKLGYVEVHHIDGDCLNNHPMNLIPLCRSCHHGTHRTQQTAARVRGMKDDFKKLVSST